MTAIIIIMLIFLSSLKTYMINIIKHEKNWEAKFNYVKYSDALEITKDNNIDETSIYYDFGVSKEKLSPDEKLLKRVHLRAYNENGLKNTRINLIEGRIPKDENEIVISRMNASQLNLGEKLELTFNENTNTYIIVGLTEKLEEDDTPSMSDLRIGAITYLNEDSLKNDDIVHICITTKNINKIYETVDKIINKLRLNDIPNIDNYSKEKIYFNEEDEALIKEISKEFGKEFNIKNEKETATKEYENKINNKVEYNKEVLKYAGILKNDYTFRNTLFLIRKFICIHHNYYRDY